MHHEDHEVELIWISLFAPVKETLCSFADNETE